MESTSRLERQQASSRADRRGKLVGAVGLAVALFVGAATTGFASDPLHWTNRAAAPGFGPAVSIGNGKLVIFGDDAAGTGITPYTYTPSTNTWAAGASIAWVANDDIFLGSEAATFAHNGTVIVMGGVDEFNAQVTKVAAYNPTTNTWKKLAPLLLARDSAAAVTGPAGKIYAIGGEAGGDSGGNGEKSLASVEAYSITTNTWQEISPLHHARYEEAAAVGSDGQIYVFGGCNQSNCNFDSTVEELDPSSASNPWQVLSAPMPKPLKSGGAAVGGPNGSLIYLNGVGAFDPVSGTWTSTTKSPINPYDFVGVGGTCGYIYGIENAAAPVPMDRAASIPGARC
jgi:N-acetylneuraminic acid mutarotase